MIRILLVESVRLTGNVMASVLEDEPDLQIVAVATTLDEATLYLTRCDLILVNFDFPYEGAMKLIQLAKTQTRAPQVIVVGLAHSEAEILPCIEAGAAGYVLKDDSVEDMVRAIRAAARGEAVISPEMAAVLMSRLRQLAHHNIDSRLGMGRLGDLTPREREILRLIGQRCNNQEIASRLVIEVGTVKNHVHNILDKLNVNNRREAAAFLNQLWVREHLAIGAGFH